jgi:predicted nucleotide-binding protein
LNRRVFVAYGHEHADRDVLVNIIASHGLMPIYLENNADGSLSIFDAFEKKANECCFAFVLLTPSDAGAAKKKGLEGQAIQLQLRARQNVIFEMGWFLARLGKFRTRLLHRGSLELPSDVIGMAAIEYNSSPLEQRAAIEQALKDGGLLEPIR